MGILSDIRVLDFGRYIAGPFCATLLGDLGAEVIRVEKRSGGEDRFLSPVAPDGTGATLLNLGRNKAGMTLDPRTDGGAEVLGRLVATADVIVANLPRNGLERMGLDYPSVSAIKPDIVLTTVDAYGDEGPYADRVGFDGVGQAMSGNAHLTGPLGHPTRSYVPWVDFGTASLAAFATVAALWHRERTGEGQHVQAALLRTALQFNSFTLTEEAVVAKGRVSTHNRGQTSGPTDLFRATDGWLVLQVVGNPIFERVARLVGRDDWLDDPRFTTDDGRGEHGAELSDVIAAWVGERTREQAIAAFNAAGVPSAPVYDAAAALADPHVVAAWMLVPTPYPGLGPVPVVAPPVSLSSTPPEPPRSAPALGADTDRVLASLGYDEDAIAGLRSSGAI
jgi:crotonobetainyl-CoA:carnitine CoA-transferase CaiB-like acyl-CoA transferase